MVQRYTEEYRSRIILLAAGLESHPPGTQTNLVLFLGAGAPREAGLPLADELKNDVIKQVFKDRTVPESAREGRLEDLMELLQTSLGNDSGYELVARSIREFKEVPASYDIIRDLISDGYIEAVVTTNFDLLFEVMAASTGVRLYFMIDDESFQGNIPKGDTVIAKLHGSASHPATMKGSWTDVIRELPAPRQEVLTGLMKNHITVFVGYAAEDKDIIPTLEAISMLSSQPVWWINPTPEPTAAIEYVLRIFGSSENYLPIDSKKFFHQQAKELAPLPYTDDKGTTPSQEEVRRIQADSDVKTFLGERELHNKRITEEHEFESKVNEICGELLDSHIVDRSILNQKASQRRSLSDIDAGEFAPIVHLLGQAQGTVQYTCAKVGSPGTGGVELVLQPVKEGRGGGLEHEFWFQIVAATSYFQELDDAGSGTGKGKVWAAAIHKIDFPGSSERFNDLKTWLNRDVRAFFQEGLSQFERMRRGAQ